MTEMQTLRSYCTVCDAEDCSCGAPRYLDEIVYKRTEEGWRVEGEAERHRFYNPPVITHSDPIAGIEPKPVQQLVVELEAWMLIEERLERKLRRCYADNPRAVTLVADHVIEAARAGQARNPAGLLVSKLRKLEEKGAKGDADIPF